MSLLIVGQEKVRVRNAMDRYA